MVVIRTNTDVVVLANGCGVAVKNFPVFVELVALKYQLQLSPAPGARDAFERDDIETIMAPRASVFIELEIAR